MSLKDTNSRVAIIIQARMGSTRFPGKILKKLIDDESVLSYLLKRLSGCRYAEKIIVATTTNKRDDILERWLKEHNYCFYRGKEDDCLERIYAASGKFHADIIVRITSDCPLVIPEIIDEMIEYYLNNRMRIDYLSNRQHTNFPEGLDVEIFNRKILKEARDNARLKKEREHINYYFLNRASKYRIRYYNHNLKFDYSRHKLSIDTLSDLRFVRRLFTKKGLALNFSFKELISVLSN